MRGGSSTVARPRRYLKRIGVAVGSLIVVAITGMFIVGPTSPALAVTPVHTVSVSDDDAVVFGTILDPRGHPLVGASVSVSRSQSRWQRPRSVQTDSKGQYRIRFDARCQKVTVVVSYGPQRHGVTGRQSLIACPGTSYDVSASLTVKSCLVFSKVTHVRLPSRTTVVSGRVTDDQHRGVAGATIVVRSREQGRTELVASTTTDSRGYYRLSFTGRCGQFEVLISTPPSSGDVLTASTRLTMCPGKGYLLDAQIHRTPAFVFLPVTSY